MADQKNQSKPSVGGKLKAGADKAAGYMLLAPGEIAGASQRMSPTTMTWLAIACGAIILLSVNVIASAVFKNSATDLTQARLYTISDSTTRVLTHVGEPITARVYFSDRLGEISSLYKRYFERVRGLLERYQTISNNKFRVEFIDPTPFSVAEDRAVAAGLQGVTIGSDGEKGYFGMVATNSTDNQEVVPFFTPQREAFLEYDMTKLVHGLAQPKKPVIGLITGVQLDGGMTMQRQQIPAWKIMSQIREFFDVKTLPAKVAAIPKDVDVLMLVHPVSIKDETAYAIDQFVMRGGRLLAFLDPVSELSGLTSPMLSGGQKNPAMQKLLTSWGVAFNPEKVVGDIASARRVQAGGGSGQVSDYVVWQAIKDDQFVKGDVVSDGVKVMNIATPGSLEPVKGATTTFTPIFKTSPSAMLIDSITVMGPRPDPVALLRNYKSDGRSYTMAARVTGAIKTAFPDGDPAEAAKKAADTKPGSKDASTAKNDKGAPAGQSGAGKPDEEKGAKPRQQSLKSGKINAIIVADSDFLYDDFWVTVQDMFGQQMMIPNSHNVVFVMNALENLSGGEALSGLRGRGVEERPFTLVDGIRREAEQKYRRSEQRLVARLQGLQKQLEAVARKATGQGAAALSLSDKDTQAIEKARADMIETRRELRSVKHAMRADIDRLEGWVKFINIALVPLLIGAGAFAIAAMRRRKAGRS